MSIVIVGAVCCLFGYVVGIKIATPPEPQCEECGTKKGLKGYPSKAHVFNTENVDDEGHEEWMTRKLCDKCAKLCGHF